MQPGRATLLVESEHGKYFCSVGTYLAICDGDIYVVERNQDEIPDPRGRRNEAGGDIMPMRATTQVILYKCPPSKDNNKVGGGSPASPWVASKDLKGHALFLGTNNCICLAAKYVPGVKENSIYFTDDYPWMVEELKPSARDVVVFNLESQSCEFLYPPDDYLTYPRPIWFVPSLH
jgi:hypothetical protein